MVSGAVTGRPTLFIDRCAWSRKLGEALDAADIPYVAHHQHFAPDSNDEDWLLAVKNNGWLIVTRDKNIRYKANEHRALMQARLLMFVLTQGGLSAEETGRILCQAYPKMARLAEHTNPPAIFSVTRSAEVRPLKLMSR